MLGAKGRVAMRRIGVASLLISLLMGFSVAGAPSPGYAAPSPSSSDERDSEHTSEVERQAAFRADIAFRSDYAYVDDLLSNPEAYNATIDEDTFGLVVTPAEKERLGFYWSFQEATSAISEYGETDAAEDYAGLYIDHDAGGYVRVSFVRNPDLHLAVIRGFFPYPERVTLFQADKTLRALEQQQTEVNAAKDALRREGIDVTHTSIEVQSNRLRVGIRRFSSEKEARIRQRFGDDVVVVEAAVDIPDGHAVDGGRDVIISPLRGGITLRERHADGTFHRHCTSNMVAYDDTSSGRAYWWLTAGHCFDSLVQVHQGRNSDGTYRRINPAENIRMRGSTDVLMIRIPSALSSPWIYVHPDDYAHVISYRQRTNEDNVGDIVCIAGQWNPGPHTTQHCGEITERNYAPTYIQDGCCFRVATYPSRGGDSGAPTYSAHVIRGIHSGTRGSDGRSFYGHISNVVAYTIIDDVVTP